MMRTIIGTVLALSAVMPRVAQAQSEQEQVFYYHTDAIGSVRMITDETGQVVARYDYLPFGEVCDLLCNNEPAPDQRRQFVGKERDQETGLDYFGARYYASRTGRFTTVDPQGVNPLWLVNPQRMNRYTYGLNNPFTYVDPDGRDAIVVNFPTGAVRAGIAFGHGGIVSVHRDGRATFADLNPVGGGSAPGVGIFGPRRGVVDPVKLPSIEFGSNGLPTAASFRALANALSEISGQSPTSIRLAYFRGSEAEASALDAWILQSQSKYSAPGATLFNSVTNNCGNFCRTGFDVGTSSHQFNGGLSFPNIDFWLLSMTAAQTYQMKPTVTTREEYCI